MGIIYNGFAKRGIDISSNNGNINWDKVIADIVVIRAGYGRVKDSKFDINWKSAKSKCDRCPYWYMDYYSNHNGDSPAFGISDSDWGKEQANNCWNFYKADSDCGIVFLDIESGGSSYSPPITTVTDRAQKIARAFLEEMDRLNGKFNGIYCSVGLITWFYPWFRNRPLWPAWYNENQTPLSVIKTCKAYGWTGKILMWQYARDGDINDDGTADGKTLGMEYGFLDLNGWIGSDEDYDTYISSGTIINPNPDPDPIPNSPLYSAKVIVKNLNVRSSPEIISGNILRVIGYVQVSIYEEENGFGKISPTNDEWISLDSKYTVKIQSLPSGISTWAVTSSNGLYIRSEPNKYSTKLGSMTYNQQFIVSSIDQNNWGKLYDKDGYCCLDYAKKLY